MNSLKVNATESWGGWNPPPSPPIIIFVFSCELCSQKESEKKKMSRGGGIEILFSIFWLFISGILDFYKKWREVVISCVPGFLASTFCMSFCNIFLFLTPGPLTSWSILSFSHSQLTTDHTLKDDRSFSWSSPSPSQFHVWWGQGCTVCMPGGLFWGTYFNFAFFLVAAS